jgi:hypothetical protein
MSSIELNDQEWTQVMGILSSAPWRDANPLLMKIGQQLQQQAVVARGMNVAGNGKEEHHGNQE